MLQFRHSYVAILHYMLPFSAKRAWVAFGAGNANKKRNSWFAVVQMTLNYGHWIELKHRIQNREVNRHNAAWWIIQCGTLRSFPTIYSLWYSSKLVWSMIFATIWIIALTIGLKIFQSRRYSHKILDWWLTSHTTRPKQNPNSEISTREGYCWNCGK